MDVQTHKKDRLETNLFDKKEVWLQLRIRSGKLVFLV